MPALAPHDQQAIRSLLSAGLPRKAVARDVGVSLNSIRRYGRDVERPRFVPASKTCVVCGATFYPNAPTQAPGRWKRRVACSVACGATLGGRPRQ